MPGNTIICGCMLHFRHTRAQLMFWQWLNQSSNTITSYSNRNGTTSLSDMDL